MIRADPSWRRRWNTVGRIDAILELHACTVYTINNIWRQQQKRIKPPNEIHMMVFNASWRRPQLTLEHTASTRSFKGSHKTDCFKSYQQKYDKTRTYNPRVMCGRLGSFLVSPWGILESSRSRTTRKVIVNWKAGVRNRRVIKRSSTSEYWNFDKYTGQSIANNAVSSAR